MADPQLVIYNLIFATIVHVLFRECNFAIKDQKFISLFVRFTKKMT